MKKGDIFLVNSNDIHYTHTHEDARYYLLQIPPVHLERISAKWEGLKFQEFIRSKSADACVQGEQLENVQGKGLVEMRENRKSTNRADDLYDQLRDVFRKIAGFYEEKKEGYHLLVLSAVYRLLYFLYTEGIRSEEDTETAHGTLRDLERMKLCMEFVREHYGERISLADAAGLLSITPEHFCRLFRKYTGQTFLAYVNQIRMEHFHTDLLETDKNITFLLDKNGITNYKGFLRKFKEAYGESPKEVRRKQLGKK